MDRYMPRYNCVGANNCTDYGKSALITQATPGVSPPLRIDGNGQIETFLGKIADKASG